MGSCSQQLSVICLTTLNILATLPAGAATTAAPSQGTQPAVKKEATLDFSKHMDPALSYLKEAEQQLNQAEPQFYGHRLKALEHVKLAINDVQTAINNYLAAHPSEPRNVVPIEPVPNEAGDPFPHMHAALKLLEHAREHLKEAARIYHGKRLEALQQTSSAIAEIRAGLAERQARLREKNEKKK